MMVIDHSKRFLGVLILTLPAVNCACDHSSTHGDGEWRDGNGIDIGNGVTIVDPGRTLFGESYNELTGVWVSWLDKEPPATNPAFDPDGGFCELNQDGPIWFLAGAFGGDFERTCIVPSDKGIFFPIHAFVSFAPDFLTPQTIHQCAQLTGANARVRCDVNDDIQIAPFIELELTIDGVDVSDLFAYRAQSQPGGFALQADEDGLLTALGFDAGLHDPAVADGYWILLEPLPPGIHTISFGVDLPNPNDDYSVSYTLTVVDDEGGD